MYEPYLIPHSHPGTHSQIAYTKSSPESRPYLGGIVLGNGVSVSDSPVNYLGI